MSEQNRIHYTILSFYDGTNPKTIELCTTDKNGNYTWISTTGERMHTVPIRDSKNPERSSKIASFVLSGVENFKKPDGSIIKKVAITPSYVPEEDLKNASYEEKVENLIALNAHQLVKTHHSVIIRNAQGGNDNPNQMGTPAFELIERTALVKAEVEYNNKVTEARGIAKDLFETKPELFIETCYAYDIPVDGIPIQKIYNILLAKIDGNPDSFMKIYNHKEAKLLSYIKRAMHTNFEDEPILSVKNGIYYFDGQELGYSDDEVIYYFGRFPQLRETLLMKLGVTEEMHITEVNNLPEEIPVAPTDAEEKFQRNRDTRRRDQMTADIAGLHGVFTRYKKKVNKAKLDGTITSVAELLKMELIGELSEKKEKYVDILDEYEAFVEKKKAEFGL